MIGEPVAIEPTGAYTPAEAAEALGVTAGEVRRRIRAGTLRARKAGSTYIVPGAEVIRAAGERWPRGKHRA